MCGAYLVAVGWLGGDTGIFLQSVRDISVPKDIVMGIIKAAVFGFIVSAISCRHGFYAAGGARGVGLATTRAVVESAVTIFVANYILTQTLIEIDF
jgi:phospholipid/cholesterol/gamma-HCH transport system permease protein